MSGFTFVTSRYGCSSCCFFCAMSRICFSLSVSFTTSDEAHSRESYPAWFMAPTMFPLMATPLSSNFGNCLLFILYRKAWP